jgi:hypothetical protein
MRWTACTATRRHHRRPRSPAHLVAGRWQLCRHDRLDPPLRTQAGRPQTAHTPRPRRVLPRLWCPLGPRLNLPRLLRHPGCTSACNSWTLPRRPPRRQGRRCRRRSPFLRRRHDPRPPRECDPRWQALVPVPRRPRAGGLLPRPKSWLLMTWVTAAWWWKTLQRAMRSQRCPTPPAPMFRPREQPAERVAPLHVVRSPRW